MISLATPDNPLIGLCRKAGRDLDPMNPLYQDVQIVPPPIALNDLVPPIPGEVEKTPQTLADIDLSLSAAPASPPVEDETTPLAREMNTKLDLARAYIEIEDKDNAREILAEVAEKGTARQRAEAQALERELGA
jgi:pilus assembly protein FimV